MLKKTDRSRLYFTTNARHSSARVNLTLAERRGIIERAIQKFQESPSHVAAKRLQKHVRFPIPEDIRARAKEMKGMSEEQRSAILTEEQHSWLSDASRSGPGAQKFVLQLDVKYNLCTWKSNGRRIGGNRGLVDRKIEQCAFRLAKESTHCPGRYVALQYGDKQFKSRRTLQLYFDCGPFSQQNLETFLFYANHIRGVSYAQFLSDGSTMPGMWPEKFNLVISTNTDDDSVKAAIRKRISSILQEKAAEHLKKPKTKSKDCAAITEVFIDGLSIPNQYQSTISVRALQKLQELFRQVDGVAQVTAKSTGAVRFSELEARRPEDVEPPNIIYL